MCLRRLVGLDTFFREGMSSEQMIWALNDFAAWCFESKGNLATTSFGILRPCSTSEIPIVSPLIKCALAGIARLHVGAGRYTSPRSSPGYMENVVGRWKFNSGAGG